MISSIIRSFDYTIINMDYTSKEPSTYLVFIPIISLYANTKMLDPEIVKNNGPYINLRNENARSEQFAKVCKWHLRGSLAQTIVCCVAFKIFASPVFLVLGLLAAFELFLTAVQANRTIEFHEFMASGEIKTRYRSALTLL